VSEKFKVATLSEMEITPMPDNPRWAAVRHHLGVGAFGINAWTADKPGMEVIEEHDELGASAGKHEEVYVVLAGRATFTVDGEPIEADPGTFVFVRDPAVRRKAVAEERGTTILAVGAQRGEAFTPSNWERSAPAFGFFATGEFDKAVETLTKVHETYPDDGGVLYNLACAESQIGRTEDAIEHLRESIEDQERFREIAKTDTDFDPIRDEPAFKELVGA
jgi:mannose-6-phosphate isomerase-like protein (cupin superfamily)